MAKGFSENAQNPQAKATQGNPERVNYQGKTPDGFANMAAAQSMEQRFEAVNREAKEYAFGRLDDKTMLATRYYLQMQADGTQEQLFAKHMGSALQAAEEQRQQMHDQINGFFAVAEVQPENFTKSLSGASSQLRLGGS